MDRQAYLDQKIKPIMENLLFQLVCERPEDPIKFMVNWLEKTGGYNPDGLTEEENDELLRLREEANKIAAQQNNVE